MPNKKNKGFRRSKSKRVSPTVTRTNRSAKRMQWTESQMSAALDAVLNNHLSGNKAAALHEVPPSTLKDRLSGRMIHGRKPGHKPYLTKQKEKELTDHLVLAAKVGYGKTRRDVMNLVETYVNSRPDEIEAQKTAADSSPSEIEAQQTVTATKPTQIEDQKPVTISNRWWFKFKKRNPLMSLRSGDSTAGVRMNAVNSESINHYFDLLEKVFLEYGFNEHPEAIYNMDETGMPLEPCPPKIVAKKGQKKVRYQTSGQKQQITIIGCGSATGHVIPPFIVFAAKQVNYLWTRNEVSGSRFAVSDNGWVDHELFSYFLTEHFIQNAVPHYPLLLLLDGHSTHFEPKSLQVAKDNNIVIFCLLPHSTHVYQTLDCSLFKPLKQQWRQECHKFYQKNPGLVVSKYNFCGIFREAWLKSITPTNVISGFRKVGIYPFNRDKILLSTDNFDNTQSSKDGKYTSIVLHDFYWHHFAGGKGNGNAIGQSVDTVEGNNDQCSNSKATKEIPLFTVEEENKFTRRYEEGYDLIDPR